MTAARDAFRSREELHPHRRDHPKPAGLQRGLTGPRHDPFDVNTASETRSTSWAPTSGGPPTASRWSCIPACPRTRGNAQRLEQVFINLILNACQSIGGRDKAITVRSRPGDTSATVRVIVRDEGAGIPAEILPRVREAFFTTREASGGTGLGLYVSQAIVTATAEPWSWPRSRGSAPRRRLPFPRRRDR